MEHCIQMGIKGQLSHSGFADRLNVCDVWSGSENVAYGQRTVEDVVADWMASPAHKANLLGDWTTCGAEGVDGYWCAIFAV